MGFDWNHIREQGAEKGGAERMEGAEKGGAERMEGAEKWGAEIMREVLNLILIYGGVDYDKVWVQYSIHSTAIH